MPPASLTQSAQIWQPSSPGFPHAATSPVSGARKPIFTTLSAPNANFCSGRPAMSVAMAVVERNWRRFIALELDLVGIGTLHISPAAPPKGARIRLGLLQVEPQITQL